MLANMFRGLFDTDITAVISLPDFLLCIVSALIIGLILAFFYTRGTKYTKSFVGTLALLPAVVCVVIMMVNGNIGAGVAVAGAFSLVRFRSAPGSAKEIGAIFLAMGTGLIVGMGYIAYAFLCAIILGGVGAIYERVGVGAGRRTDRCRTLSITIPEDLEYMDVFGPVFDDYVSDYELRTVRTTNMGSLFRLTYHVTLKKAANEKEMIDKLRCRNGNLEISLSSQETSTGEL